jgi:hypothetical protein
MARRVEISGNDSRLLGRGCKPNGHYGKGWATKTGTRTCLDCISITSVSDLHRCAREKETSRIINFERAAKECENYQRKQPA